MFFVKLIVFCLIFYIFAVEFIINNHMVINNKRQRLRCSPSRGGAEEIKRMLKYFINIYYLSFNF